MTPASNAANKTHSSTSVVTSFSVQSTQGSTHVTIHYSLTATVAGNKTKLCVTRRIVATSISACPVTQTMDFSSEIPLQAELSLTP